MTKNDLAAAFGFSGIAGTAASIAEILFFVFLVLFAVNLNQSPCASTSAIRRHPESAQRKHRDRPADHLPGDRRSDRPHRRLDARSDRPTHAWPVGQHDVVYRDIAPAAKSDAARLPPEQCAFVNSKRQQSGSLLERGQAVERNSLKWHVVLLAESYQDSMRGISSRSNCWL
ncbi:MAG: DUF1328 domain-containing protein [Planctomycetaceae bacterium]|nr:DUF1328 domain-containing protein [Planctomycetaceae bacterium]